MADQRSELRPLTTFRFIAALAVFLRHTLPWLESGVDLPSFLRNGFHDGFCGVTFFYILSGFILTYNYRDAFARPTVSGCWRFYAARLARIYPVHLLTFIVALPLVYREVLALPAQAVGPALANITLTQSFIPEQSFFFSFNTVSWSLSDELFFYALLPLVLWGMHAVGWGRVRPAIGLAGLLWLVALGCVLLWRDHPNGLWLWYVNPGFRLLDFLVGVSLGQIYLSLRDRGAAGPSKRLATMLEIGSLALVAAALLACPSVPYLLRRSAYYTPVFAAVIFVFAFERGMLSRLLSLPGLRLLGEASFSFYMFHYIFIRLIDCYPHATRLGDWPPLLRTLAVFLLSLTVSVCCFCWYELPLRSRVKRWLAGGSARGTVDPGRLAIPLRTA